MNAHKHLYKRNRFDKTDKKENFFDDTYISIPEPDICRISPKYAKQFRRLKKKYLPRKDKNRIKKTKIRTMFRFSEK